MSENFKEVYSNEEGDVCASGYMITAGSHGDPTKVDFPGATIIAAAGDGKYIMTISNDAIKRIKFLDGNVGTSVADVAAFNSATTISTGKVTCLLTNTVQNDHTTLYLALADKDGTIGHIASAWVPIKIIFNILRA